MTGDVREGRNETREEAAGELGGGGGDEGRKDVCHQRRTFK